MAAGAGAEKMRATVDGIGIHVDRFGSGTPVMLIHGLGGPAMWDRIVEIICDEREVIVPHLPGFGESPAPGGPLDAAGHARLLARFLDDADLTGVTPGGHELRRRDRRAPRGREARPDQRACPHLPHRNWPPAHAPHLTPGP